MFPPVQQPPVEERWARELVDDAASSICIDGQDYVELDKAIEVFDQHNDQPLTDFEKYNRIIARQMILGEEMALKDTHGTLDLDSYREPDRRAARSQPYIKYDLFKFLVFGGCMPLGTWIELQNLLYRTGPFGSFVGVVIGVVLYELSFGPLMEMMAFYPLKGGLGSYIGAYLHPSLGFGMNVCYWFVCAVGAPTELVIALPVLSQFPQMNTPDNTSHVWMIYFVALILVLRLANKHVQMGIAAVSCLIVVLTVCAYSILAYLAADGKLGHYDFGHSWGYWSSAYQCSQTTRCGLFKTSFGNAGGAGGRLMQLIDATMIGFSASSTVDKVYTMLPDVRNPRRSVRQSRWYRRMRELIFYILFILAMTLIMSKDDPAFDDGVAFPQPTVPIQSPRGSSVISSNGCPLELTQWQGHENMRTYAPLSIGFARRGICWGVLYVAAGSVFMGIAASKFFHLASTYVLASLLEDHITRLPAGLKDIQAHMLAQGLNISICVVVFIVGWCKCNALIQFFILCENHYVYWFMPLLSVAYLRFRQVVDQSGLDRNDLEWPYRAWHGKLCAYVTIVIIGTFCVMQYFFYAIPFGLWSAKYFFGRYLPLLVCLVFAGLHWLVRRPQFVRIADIDILAAKQSLDDQEWIEDRVFRRGIKGKLANYAYWLRWYVGQTVAKLRLFIKKKLARKSS